MTHASSHYSELPHLAIRRKIIVTGQEEYPLPSQNSSWGKVELEITSSFCLFVDVYQCCRTMQINSIFNTAKPAEYPVLVGVIAPVVSLWVSYLPVSEMSKVLRRSPSIKV